MCRLKLHTAFLDIHFLEANAVAVDDKHAKLGCFIAREKHQAGSVAPPAVGPHLIATLWKA
jgi:hypothetical protein